MLVMTRACRENTGTWHANTGGPCSRTRTERVQRTLLGRDDGRIRIPRRLRVGLECEANRSIVDAVDEVLTDAGFHSAEQLRAAFVVPAAPLLCRPFIPGPGELVHVADAPPAAVLEQALLLGLCSAHLYDPARPLIWTTASLTRRLELFQPEGFYAS